MKNLRLRTKKNDLLWKTTYHRRAYCISIVPDLLSTKPDSPSGAKILLKPEMKFVRCETFNNHRIQFFV